MKLGVLVNNREVLQKLYHTQFDGRKAVQVRRAVKGLSEELETFEEARNDYIRKHGKGNPPKINPGTEDFQKFLKYINEMADADITDPKPVLMEQDLGGIELSVAEIDGLIAIGLLKAEQDKKADLPRPKKKSSAAGERKAG